MLNCIAASRAKKTAGIAGTYRAAPGDMYGTCPDTCPLKPVETKTREIDREYESAVRHSVPKHGLAFLFTHFAPHLWAERNTGDRAQCTFNYSAPTLEAAANETALGNASVAVVAAVVHAPPLERRGHAIDVPARGLARLARRVRLELHRHGDPLVAHRELRIEAVYKNRSIVAFRIGDPRVGERSVENTRRRRRGMTRRRRRSRGRRKKKHSFPTHPLCILPRFRA